MEKTNFWLGKYVAMAKRYRISKSEVYLRKGTFLKFSSDINNFDKKRLDYVCKISQIYNEIMNTKYGYNSRFLKRFQSKWRAKTKIVFSKSSILQSIFINSR